MKKDIIQVTEQELRDDGHVMRMEDCRTARQVAELTPQGKGRAWQSSRYMEGWD
jgi:hypothetical protein